MSHNVSTVQHEIAKKLNYNIPYYATHSSIQGVMTDMDNFPYKRFFRGVYYNDRPVVLERETGWRPLNNPCYRDQVVNDVKEQTYCWQSACNTVQPCNKKLYQKAAEGKPKKVNISP